jgi:hypothetical protein
MEDLAADAGVGVLEDTTVIQVRAHEVDSVTELKPRQHADVFMPLGCRRWYRTTGLRTGLIDVKPQGISRSLNAPSLAGQFRVDLPKREPKKLSWARMVDERRRSLLRLHASPRNVGLEPKRTVNPVTPFVNLAAPTLGQLTCVWFRAAAGLNPRGLEPTGFRPAAVRLPRTGQLWSVSDTDPSSLEAEPDAISQRRQWCTFRLQIQVQYWAARINAESLEPAAASHVAALH